MFPNNTIEYEYMETSEFGKRKALSTLNSSTVTVAVFSPFSATVALFCDSFSATVWTGLKCARVNYSKKLSQAFGLTTLLWSAGEVNIPHSHSSIFRHHHWLVLVVLTFYAHIFSLKSSSGTPPLPPAVIAIISTKVHESKETKSAQRLTRWVHTSLCDQFTRQ